MIAIYFQALFMGFGLIIAIGAQNIFIIKIGLQKNNVMLAASVAALCDAVLIAIGTLFMGFLTTKIPYFLPITKWLGCLYLLFYGVLSLFNAISKTPKDWNTAEQELTNKSENKSQLMSATKIIIAVLFFSLLNPHVFIDTLIILGNFGSKLPDSLQPIFILGATTASCIWFFSIGFGAKKAAKWFTKTSIARTFDFLSAMIMFFIAYQLAIFDVQL